MRQRLLLPVLVTLLLAACAPKPSYSGAVIDPPLEWPDFTLQSAEGPVSLSDFAGKYVALFFGFTKCMDICPTTLANLNYALNEQGEKAEDLQVVFVSVDHQRDSPEAASQYAQVFNPAFVGVTGTKEEIDAVTSEMGVYYLFEDPDEQGNYEVEHTSTVLVLDPDRRLVLTWPSGTTADQVKQDLDTLLGN
jgi:protein SCO1/2